MKAMPETALTALLPEGRARVFGDDINTDYIIASRRKRESLDPQVLRQYLFEELDPGFAASLASGDLVVAGKNFGCGSAMEVAVTALLGAGIRAVLARSFSRTYYRNAINNGLLPVICDTRDISESDRIVIASPGGDQKNMAIRNTRTGKIISAAALPQIMLDIFQAGGLVPYFRQYGDFRI
ncbi:MAG TPA: alpha-IPM isomerase [Candidatus Angelobacter sp.]|nr:alpha-IPM isomerase [Candidatus Angelobacter sp.]